MTPVFGLPAGRSRQMHRREAGTFAMTASTCRPQPAQPVLPQSGQCTEQHTGVPLAATYQTPAGAPASTDQHLGDAVGRLRAAATPLLKTLSRGGGTLGKIAVTVDVDLGVDAMADEHYDAIVIGTSQGGRFLPIELAKVGQKGGARRA